MDPDLNEIFSRCKKKCGKFGEKCIESCKYVPPALRSAAGPVGTLGISIAGSYIYDKYIKEQNEGKPQTVIQGDVHVYVNTPNDIKSYTDVTNKNKNDADEPDDDIIHDDWNIINEFEDAPDNGSEDIQDVNVENDHDINSSSYIMDECKEVKVNAFSKYGLYHQFGRYNIADDIIVEVYGKYENEQLHSLCLFPKYMLGHEWEDGELYVGYRAHIKPNQDPIEYYASRGVFGPTVGVESFRIYNGKHICGGMIFATYVYQMYKCQNILKFHAYGFGAALLFCGVSCIAIGTGHPPTEIIPSKNDIINATKEWIKR